MRPRPLTFQDIRNRNDPGLNANGDPRPLCGVCESPIKPGDVVIRLDQFEVMVSQKSGQDLYQDMHFEDGDSEKLYHFGCVALHVDPHIIGADNDAHL